MFLGGLLLWFMVAWQINSSETNVTDRAENFQGLWIVSFIVTVFLRIIFFPKTKKEHH